MSQAKSNHQRNSPNPTLLIWADSNQSSLIEKAVTTLGAHIIAIGGPDADAATLHNTFDAAPIVDLRHALLEHAAHTDLIWLAANTPVDADLLPPNTNFATALPIFLQHHHRKSANSQPRIYPINQFIHSPGYQLASDALHNISTLQSLNYHATSQHHLSCPAAMLLDCCHLLHTLCQPIQHLHAVTPTAPHPPKAIETIHDLSHMVSMTFKTNSGMAGNAYLQNNTPPNPPTQQRKLTLHTIDHHQLTITDNSFCLQHTTTSDIIDSDSTTDHLDATTLIINSLQSILNQDMRPFSDTTRSIESLCETARLSVATTESESPQRMLEVMTRTI